MEGGGGSRRVTARVQPGVERLDSWDDDEAEDWHPAAVVQRTVNIRRLSMARIHNAMTAAEFVSAMTALVDGDVAAEQEPLSPLWSQVRFCRYRFCATGELKYRGAVGRRQVHCTLIVKIIIKL
jgi:hypothetical protein